MEEFSRPYEAPKIVGPESEDQRNERLSVVISQAMPEVSMPDDLLIAVNLVRQREDRTRLAVADPNLGLTPDLVTDDLKAVIATEIAAHATREELENLDASIASGASEDRRLDQELGKRAAKRDLEAELVDQNSAVLKVEESAEAEISTDLETVQDLQQNFISLRASLGTEGALRTLLEPGRLKSAEMTAMVERVLATVQALATAIPGKENVVRLLLDSAPMDLTAQAPSQVFGGFLTQIDQSLELTDSERVTLRSVIINDHAVHTGKQLSQDLRQTVTDPETGETLAAFTRQNPKQVRDGVECFTDDDKNLKLRFTPKGKPPVEIDVTQKTTAEIGLLAEALGFAYGLEDVGLGVFADAILEDAWLGPDLKVDGNDLADLRRLMAALMGGMEAYDGDIFDVGARKGLLEFMASQLGLVGLQPDQQGPRLVELGLTSEGGKLDFASIEQFGRFSRAKYGFERP